MFTNEENKEAQFISHIFPRLYDLYSRQRECKKTPLFRWHLHFIVIHVDSYKGCRLPRWHRGKESACQSRRWKRQEFDPWVAKIPWRRKWEPTPVSLLGRFHGPRNLVVCSPWGCKELDTHTHTHTHTHTPIWQWLFFTGTSALFQQTLTTTGSGDPIYGKGLLSKMPAQIVPLFRDPEDI